MEATDNGSPQARTGTAVVEVSVVRDIFSPDILNLPASRSISENTPQGDSIFRGQASDQDQTVSNCPFFFFNIWMKFSSL